MSTATAKAKPTLPGATIGIFGGGQLGRMTAMAARGMGYRILVLDPDPACPARFVVDAQYRGGLGTIRARRRNLGSGMRCGDVAEIEQISPQSMAAAANFAPVRPGGAMLRSDSGQTEQKLLAAARMDFAAGQPDYRAVRSLDELRDGRGCAGRKVLRKSATGVDMTDEGRARLGFTLGADGWRMRVGALGSRWVSGLGAAEKLAIDLEREISALVARAPNGEAKVYPAAWNYPRGADSGVERDASAPG